MAGTSFRTWGGDFEPGNVHDASTTVATCNGDDRKKTGDGDTVSRSRAAIQKPVRKRADDPKGTYGGGKAKLHSSQNFSKTLLNTAITLLHPLRLHGFRPAKIRFVTVSSLPSVTITSDLSWLPGRLTK